MNIKALSIGVAALTFAGIGTAAAQAVYIERITPAPTYVAPAADIDGYVIEQRVVPAAPVVTYERQVITPRAIVPQQRIVTERRVVTEPSVITRTQPTIVRTTEPRVVMPADDDTTYVTDTDAVTTGVSSCSYDSFGRMICD